MRPNAKIDKAERNGASATLIALETRDSSWLHTGSGSRREMGLGASFHLRDFPVKYVLDYKVVEERLDELW
jgi:hypothetical protein